MKQDIRTTVKKLIETAPERARHLYARGQEQYARGKNALPEKWQKRVDRGEDLLQECITKVRTFDRRLLTWFPFVGWMYTLWRYWEEEFLMTHIRQAAVMAGFFAMVDTTLYVLTFMVPVNWRLFRLLVILTIYGLHVLYGYWIVKGTKAITRKETLEIPYVARYAERLEI